jgi:F-type H+-transporting ATPase subunit a
MYQALEQFKVINYQIFSYNIPNYIISLLTLTLFFFLITFMLNLKNIMFLTQNFVQIIFEELYLFVLSVIKQNIGNLGVIYFPVVFNVFYFIYFVNIGGLIGYNLQLTSHIFVTFTISISLFIGVIIIGIYNLKAKFLNQFIPKDAPKLLFPLLVVIETISYIIRPFTLGIRLFANMFSGHVLLFVIISFVIVIVEKKLIIIKILLLIFPIMLLFFIMTLELLIMFLQAYVFIILFCVYLNDSLHAH